MNVVVADTGPVHYLVLIEEISLLPALFDHVILPATVRDEMLHPKTPDPIRQWMETRPNWVSVLPDPPPQSNDLLSPDLDEGERAAIRLAIFVKANLVLMDDRAGVIAAKQSGLLVTGTLGVLNLAAHRGLVDLEQAIQRLARTNFRYPRALVERLLGLHGRKTPRE